jgi:hypothetical protein
MGRRRSFGKWSFEEEITDNRMPDIRWSGGAALVAPFLFLEEEKKKTYHRGRRGRSAEVTEIAERERAARNGGAKGSDLSARRLVGV